MVKALVIRDLYKTYSDGFTALKGIDLDVEQGDFFALLGPNGAGKSTVIGIVISLINKSRGNVSIFGYDLDRQLQAAQSLVGVVPQEFNFNIFEKVKDIVYNQAGFYGISRRSAQSRVEYYLKKLDLWDKRNTPANRLSGGMKRRLMIVRAMVHEPKLLILDEPTAGVDLEIRRTMWNFLTELNKEKGTTIILTTHYLEEAEQLCNNIAIIDRGRVVEQTDMKSLLMRLESQTFVLDVEDLAPYRGGGKSRAFPNIENFTITVVDANTLEVRTSASKNISSLFVELEKHGIVVKNMRNKANRLEELFLQLVGTSKE
ncbi:MAG: ABC transporter [Gammaproteobacteria bacterium]|nr:MAG: ABC transporter [Gammaproteobacteria bacterium]